MSYNKRMIQQFGHNNMVKPQQRIVAMFGEGPAIPLVQAAMESIDKLRSNRDAKTNVGK